MYKKRMTETEKNKDKKVKLKNMMTPIFCSRCHMSGGQMTIEKDSVRVDGKMTKKTYVHVKCSIKSILGGIK